MTFRERFNQGNSQSHARNSFHALTTAVCTWTDALRKSYNTYTYILRYSEQISCLQRGRHSDSPCDFACAIQKVYITEFSMWPSKIFSSHFWDVLDWQRIYSLAQDVSQGQVQIHCRRWRLEGFAIDKVWYGSVVTWITRITIESYAGHVPIHALSATWSNFINSEWASWWNSACTSFRLKIAV